MIPIRTGVLVLLASLAIAQNQELKIVVIKGEDAVNIIQQKTAVAPVIEVRDRNNLPVSGAAVTFTIGGGQGATFGGISTLTVTTNAAGQAAAVGFTPTAAGAVQINAAAVFQGQTAIATITQTNVLTAAQAATAAGATGGASGGAGGGGATGGAAAGGGGGLSTTTLVVAGAAVAGGAVAATQLGGSGDEGTREFAGNFSGDMVLNFTGCTRVERRAGLLTIELQDTGDGPVNGTAGIEGGTTTILSNTGNQCSPTLGPQPGQVQPFGMPVGVVVSGTTSSLTFSHTENIRANDGSIGSQGFSFTGSKTGDTITGTFTVTQTVQNAIPLPVSGTSTMSVTLTPH